MKSWVVVKYFFVFFWIVFVCFEEKIDLKFLFVNWLWESVKLGLVGIIIFGNSKKSKLFLSFGMVYDFIDLVGNDVDVVFDFENIKKFLKIFYSKLYVSMVVYCIGRILLLDELDI